MQRPWSNPRIRDRRIVNIRSTTRTDSSTSSTRSPPSPDRFNAATCAQWTRNAGLKSRWLGHCGREEFLRLRQGGAARGEVTAEIGIHPRTARDWDRGVRRSGNTRIYPDGRVVDYNHGVTTMITPPRPPAGMRCRWRPWANPSPLATSRYPNANDPRYEPGPHGLEDRCLGAEQSKTLARPLVDEQITRRTGRALPVETRDAEDVGENHLLHAARPYSRHLGQAPV